MKATIQNALVIFSMLLLLMSCNKDDDNADSQPPQRTNLELLTSGKWYFESKTPGTYTACEKMGYIQFMTNGTAILNSFDNNSGTCESLGEVTITYTLTNNVNLMLVLGTESQSAIINSVTDSELRITNSDTGEINMFDKIEG